MKTFRLTSALVLALWTAVTPMSQAADQNSSKPVPPSSAASLTAPSRFSGTSWRNEDASIIVDFFNTGSWHERYHKKLVRGSWKIVSEKEAMVTISDGRVFHYVMSRDGNSLKRDDGVRYIPNK